MCTMRKIRPRQSDTKGVLNANVTRAHATIDLTEIPEWSESNTMLCDEDLILVRPHWASFELETRFWKLLEKICTEQGVPPQEFVESVQHKYIGEPIDRALRIIIATYFFLQQGWVPQEEEVRAKSVHETEVPRL